MRKVLSFVLVLSLVLGSFSMAFAANEAQASLSDIAGNANEEAITVNFNLKIIDGMGDGTFAPDQQVTRAQFAAMITRALAIPESALAGYKTSTFKDTTGYGWAVPYLAFCQSKGILVGDGAGNVMPGRTVSVNEAVTMVMRAVGYTNNSAALVGVWPANYVSLAQNSNLYKNVATAVGVTRGNAAQIIYNALTVDKVEVSADGTTKVLSDRTVNPKKIVNMLTTGLNATEDTDYTVIGNEDTLINLTPYIGKVVTVYKEKDKPNRILAIASEDSTAIDGEFAADILVTNGSISNAPKFEGDDDVDYTISFKSGANIRYIMENGEIASIPAAGYAITSDESVTINADVSGKTVKEIYTITKWNEDGAKKVSKSDLNQLSEQRLLSFDFATLKDKSIDKTSFQLIGVASLDKIAENNVVYVYTKGGDGKEINKVEVGTTVVTGEVTKIKGSKYTVDGKEYKFATTKGAESDRPEVGDEVVLYLDAAGKIYDFDNKTGSNDKYAVMIQNAYGKDEYKFYTADDEDLWINLKQDARDVIGTPTSAGILNNKIIGYSLNKDGSMNSADIDRNHTSLNHTTLSSVTLLQTANGNKYSVKSDAVVFGYNASNVVVTATKIDNVETGKDLTTVYFKLNKKNEVVALIVPEGETNKSADDVYAVIDGIAKVTNADKDKVLQLTGYANGAKLDKLTDDNYTSWTAPTLPELWKIDLKSDGTIKSRIVIDNTNLAKYGTMMGGKNTTVSGIKNNGQTLILTGSGIRADGTSGAVNDTVALAKNVVVYRAVIADNEVDYYATSDATAITEGNSVYLYETDDDEDGYDVVIIVNKW